jgi:hypothetical protein
MNDVMVDYVMIEDVMIEDVMIEDVMIDYVMNVDLHVYLELRHLPLLLALINDVEEIGVIFYLIHQHPHFYDYYFYLTFSFIL